MRDGCESLPSESMTDSTNAANAIRRVTKACSSCRSSKLRCDGQKPCSRCDKLGKDCIYLSRPVDPIEARFERLDAEIGQLRGQIAFLQSREAQGTDHRPDYHQVANTFNTAVTPTENSLPAHAFQLSEAHTYAGMASSSPLVHHAQPGGHPPGRPSPSIHHGSIASPTSALSDNRKRRRTQIELRNDTPLDFITKGLISIEQARTYWEDFFGGCDRFVPVFDPSYDTFESVRFRNSFLFNAVCTMGCTVGDGESQLPHVLNFELKKLLNQVVMAQTKQSLEVVQALLVIACYSSERSLVLSFATRLALDVGMVNAFEELTASLMSTDAACNVDRAHLIRCSRTWFELLVLENMLQVDAGKLPTFATKGSARRCRVLLQQPETTPLDLRLLSQVELNHLRTKIHHKLQQHDGGSGEDVLDEIRDARIDIDVWFADWENLMANSQIAGIERPMLLVNLKVQRHWCEAMTYFRGVKCLGIENIDAMSPEGRKLLAMAKSSLKAHLATTLEEPNYYLSNLRFAMDFVWAKCSFCFLLLLKLTRLLPESDADDYQLLEDGNKLYEQLSNAGTCAGSSTSRLYVQVLGMGLEKYGRALRQRHATQPGQTPDVTYFWDASDANVELQSFVPEQFVWEWTFPGLSLWSSPAAWQEFFDGKSFIFATV